MYCIYMATKTITVELKAYNKLVRARRSQKESFSQVIYRAEWPDSGVTGKQLLSHMNRLGSEEALLSNSELEALDQAQAQDTIPEDKWSF